MAWGFIELKDDVTLPGNSLGETTENPQHSSVNKAVVKVKALNWISGCAESLIIWFYIQDG
jgi:hypothetical protein